MPTQLPWGMTAFRTARGEALYVCIDEPFDAVNYGTSNPSGNFGAVMVIPLREDGASLPAVAVPRCLAPRVPECCHYAAAHRTADTTLHHCLKDPSRRAGVFVGLPRAGQCRMKGTDMVLAS